MERKVNFNINGKKVELNIDSRELLVDVIRDHITLKGTRIGCDTSNCGACTVIVNGKAVKSCTMLGVQADGKEIITIEGITQGEELHPIQKAFMERHGMQCGYCTSGMIMTAYWLLSNRKNPSDEEIKRYFSGNLCRCTGYQDIIDSVRYASELMHSEEEKIVVEQR